MVFVILYTFVLVHGAIETRLKLKPYCDEGSDRLYLFIRREQTPANHVIYDEVFTHQTLQEALANKTIIEFPEIYVTTLKGTSEFRQNTA
jgi:hypothetical protein